MTVADDVLRALAASEAGLSDAELASTLGKRHQQINQTCRTLASQGLIARDNSYGGIVNRPTDHVQSPRLSVPVQAPVSSGEQEWAWEGNVQARIVAHLAATGWSIVRVADTAQRERGTDIIAERDRQKLLVEVKGWPSRTYARGERTGQPKPTQPTTQAAVWFAQALTSLIRHGSEPGIQLAIGLPDMPRYRALLADAAWALNRLDIAAYLVASAGTVESWERED